MLAYAQWIKNSNDAQEKMHLLRRPEMSVIFHLCLVIGISASKMRKLMKLKTAWPNIKEVSKHWVKLQRMEEEYFF